MAILQGLLFLFFGIGLLVIDYQSLRKGWLPCGSNGFRGRLEFRKDEQPVGYWLMFVVYAAGGIWLTFLALQILVGLVEPVPLR